VEPKVLKISHLLIPPPEAIFSLRRILNFLIQVIASGATKIDNVEEVIEQAENAILSGNEEYYKKLEKLLASGNSHKLTQEVREVLNNLVRHQLELLSRYRDSIGN
jgi:hypothetical protein